MFKHRIERAESAILEAQLARLNAHRRGLTDTQLDLICEIAESQQTGVWLREYTAEECSFFDAHCDFMHQFSDDVHLESSRRSIAELLADGKITRAEVLEKYGPEYLPKFGGL